MGPFITDGHTLLSGLTLRKPPRGAAEAAAREGGAHEWVLMERSQAFTGMKEDKSPGKSQMKRNSQNTTVEPPSLCFFLVLKLMEY